MGQATIPEARRALVVVARLTRRAYDALNRRNPEAATACLREATAYLDDALALSEAHTGQEEWARWSAAVDRAIDAGRRPWTYPEWPR